MIRIICLVFCLLCFSLLPAQKAGTPVKLTWKGVKTLSEQQNEWSKIVYFDGASYSNDYPGLPFFNINVPLKAAASGFDAQIEVLATIPVTAEEQKVIGDIPAFRNLIFEQNVVFERKKPLAHISVFPIRKNPSTGVLEKITDFKINIRETGNPKPRGKSHDYAQTSKLASGEWYRIGVTENGVYSIDRNFLLSLGINVSDLDPRDLNIYGTGFGQLPYENSIPRPDDLPINRIEISGENDGSFDPGDKILFYGKGPHSWTFNQEEDRFVHAKHLYSDTTYYFIGIGIDPPHRINTIQSTGTPATDVVTDFDDYVFHEPDNVNVIKSGNNWLGETFDFVTTYNFTGDKYTFPNINQQQQVRVTAQVASRSITVPGSRFVLSAGGASNTISLSQVSTNTTSAYAVLRSGYVQYFPSSSVQNINLTYQKNTPSAIGWLDYLEVNVRRHLIMAGNQMEFRDKNSFGPGKVAEFHLQQANSVQQVWDVTDPINVMRVNAAVSDGNLTFRANAETLKQFIAITGNINKIPVPVGRVPNQNLHAMGLNERVDMVIVTHPMFLAQSEELADFHRSDEEYPLNVAVVTTQQVYNEFSAGSRDITAIKWLMKMLYDRAGENEAMMPRYLLLFGDGSFDNRSGITNNTNFVPTYQTIESLSPAASTVSDDYFGFLDDEESFRTQDIVDIGIGRMPVKTVQDAKAMVNKVKQYMSHQPVENVMDFQGTCNNCNTNFGEWRNIVALVADDKDVTDGNIFVSQSYGFAKKIEENHAEFNVEHIMLDAYQQVSTPGGQRYPGAAEAIRRRVEQGALIVNYIGHGGEVGWASERVLDISTIQNWQNINSLPLIVTATCEFSRFDDPTRTSAGEYALLNPNGGAIALFTTTRLVYINNNEDINSSFFDYALQNSAYEDLRLGDIARFTKRDNIGSSNNHMNFSLLGDPAVKLKYPQLDVITTAITDTLGSPIDTIRALDVVRINGYVADRMGNKVSNFNGLVKPVIYDKKANLQTLANDGGATFPYKSYKNVIYKGNAQAVNGDFSFDFMVPKDIDYMIDSTARISYYVLDGQRDGNGYKNNLTVGGINENAPIDNEGPQLELYINDENFVFGGYTDENPVLVAKLFDENGINTVGNGIGHDLKATLDGNTSNSLVLNDYYESDLNTYKSGIIRYPFSKLEEGEHTLALKVWDAFNNSSDSYTEFIVSSSADFALKRVLNYPNPFTTHTEFYFEHNQACEFFNVQIQIFTISGRVVKTINSVVNSEGFRNEAIAWDGRDDFGDKLGRGIYVYRVAVRNPSGLMAEKIEKLVILK